MKYENVPPNKIKKMEALVKKFRSSNDHLPAFCRNNRLEYDKFRKYIWTRGHYIPKAFTQSKYDILERIELVMNQQEENDWTNKESARVAKVSLTIYSDAKQRILSIRSSQKPNRFSGSKSWE